MNDIEKIFAGLGGQFITPFTEFRKKAVSIKAFVFDWDGVFNSGIKVSEDGSPFSEPDSMGLNMLKLNYWLLKKTIPPTFIITGENNKTALRFARRENMNAVFLSYKDKTEALDFICKEHGLKKEETAFVFDDILDIGVAAKAGLSFLVDHPGSPLTKDFIISNGICDYVTGNTGGGEAVREVCELLIGTTGDMHRTIDTRIRFKGDYEKYLKEKSCIETQLFRYEKH